MGSSSECPAEPRARSAGHLRKRASFCLTLRGGDLHAATLELRRASWPFMDKTASPLSRECAPFRGEPFGAFTPKAMSFFVPFVDRALRRYPRIEPFSVALRVYPW